MSITNDLKGYADAAVETGRSVINDGISQSRTAVNDGLTQGRTVVNERITKLRTTIDGGFDGAGDRAGKFAETASGAGTQAFDRARYDVYAAVGAVDAVVTSVVTRLQELPTDVVGTFTKVQNSATDAADKVQGRFQTVLGKAGETVGSTQKTVDDVRSGAIIGKTRESAEAYRKQAEKTYGDTRADLHARGTAVVTEFRNDPRVQRVAGLVGAATATVEDTAAKPSRRRAAEKAQETRAHNERSARAKKAATTRARKTAAPAKTARKSAAKKATKATKATS